MHQAKAVEWAPERQKIIRQISGISNSSCQTHSQTTTLSGLPRFVTSTEIIGACWNTQLNIPKRETDDVITTSRELKANKNEK